MCAGHRRHLIAVLAVLAFAHPTHAQGPNTAYFFTPEVTLDWAHCAVYQPGGSELVVPFLPVVASDPQRAPLGTEKYTRDIDLDAGMVYVRDGVVSETYDAYTKTFADDGVPIDVAGRVVMLCYDCPPPEEWGTDSLPTVSERIAIARDRGAVGVVLYSSQKDNPFLYVDQRLFVSAAIPAITVSRNTARAIIAAAGLGSIPDNDTLGNREHMSRTREMITRIRLAIRGAFDRIATPDFTYLYRADKVPEAWVRAAADAQQLAIQTIRRTIGSDTDTMPRSLNVYFAGYDSKLFYTHHWGYGLSSAAGAFIVRREETVDTGLIAHEYVHTFTGANWGNSSSFMNEGVARYVESVAIDPDRDHRETIAFLANDRLPPLRDMIYIDIGSDSLTQIAYPASGSFTAFVIATEGLHTYRKLFDLEGRALEEKTATDSWQSACGKPLATLDTDWRAWLQKRK
ncbi:MAG TPA: hypothetical protein VLB27_08100 [candidate division Zixibacteria bacterium]|nr:hypothetical protein [candidate division Zixibacteria bacterium]